MHVLFYTASLLSFSTFSCTHILVTFIAHGLIFHTQGTHWQCLDERGPSQLLGLGEDLAVAQQEEAVEREAAVVGLEGQQLGELVGTVPGRGGALGGAGQGVWSVVSLLRLYNTLYLWGKPRTQALIQLFVACSTPLFVLQAMKSWMRAWVRG